ncbi:hypothetical protein B0H15DRAFT_926102 [Mycena belliarum]|uniref:Uncharacterized protein n=1 Tax=Mycena belliarum TaxID=1033014 RepID=A0AAD6XY27_9AGAR|nr:hypothetical protein B0H15DRAFT_926102 [Mycena belliae]
MLSIRAKQTVDLYKAWSISAGHTSVPSMMTGISSSPPLTPASLATILAVSRPGRSTVAAGVGHAIAMKSLMEIASVLLGRDAHQHKPTTGKRLSKEELDTSPSGHAVNFYQPAAKPIVDAGGLVIYEKSSALGCYTQTHYQHRQSAHFFRQWMRKVSRPEKPLEPDNQDGARLLYWATCRAVPSSAELRGIYYDTLYLVG